MVGLSAVVLGLLRAYASLWATLPLSLPEPYQTLAINNFPTKLPLVKFNKKG
jgi:hypothetical protein